MMLTQKQKDRKLELLKKWYNEGYLFFCKSKYDTYHLAKGHKGKTDYLGVWNLFSPRVAKLEKKNQILFDDVKWENDEPLNILDEISKLEKRR